MQAISLKLPESVLQASTEAAQSLGINRSEFIRQAIQNETRRMRKKRLAQAWGELSRDPRFMAEFEEWEASTVADGLADEEAEGWFSLPEDKNTP